MLRQLKIRGGLARSADRTLDLRKAPVAQWIESRTSNPKVVGSNPTGRVWRQTSKTIVVLEKAVLGSQQDAKARDAQIAKMMATLEAMESNRKTMPH